MIQGLQSKPIARGGGGGGERGGRRRRRGRRRRTTGTVQPAAFVRAV